MGRTKKPTYKPRTFESKGEHYTTAKGRTAADTSANIYESMLTSPAFKALKPRLKVLYLYCKAQYYGKRKPTKDNDKYGTDTFYFNWGKALEYGLYPESAASNFYHDMQELEKAGFIKKLFSGKAHKEKNVYQYSNEWQQRG